MTEEFEINGKKYTKTILETPFNPIRGSDPKVIRELITVIIECDGQIINVSNIWDYLS